MKATIWVLALSWFAGTTTFAWDYEGHRLINQLALASMPAEFPNFVRTPAARERIAFLGGEPDRWRNNTDLPFKHANGPDHYFDFDELPDYGLTSAQLSPFRYEFTRQLAEIRVAHPTRFRPIDPAKDADLTKTLPGFLPWAIAEYYGKLKSSFSYLKALEDDGTPEEVTNAQQNILYVMGVMGHYVGDGSQPLHTTHHYNGWIGDNPHRYTTNRTFHAWIDGGYFGKAGLQREPLFEKIRPARLLAKDGGGTHTNLFPTVVKYLEAQYLLVERLYQLDRDRKLPGKTGVDPEGYALMSGQLVVGAQMLGDLWLTAWRSAPPDTFLRAALAKRKLQAKE